jgi:hypothetical protein
MPVAALPAHLHTHRRAAWPARRSPSLPPPPPSPPPALLTLAASARAPRCHTATTPNCPQPPRQARGPSCRPRSPVSPPARARPSPTREQERRRHDQHTTQRPQASPAPGRRRGAHRRRRARNCCHPGFRCQGHLHQPGQLPRLGYRPRLDRGRLPALAHRDRYRGASATPAVLSGPAWRKAGTAAAAQPRSGPDNRRSSRTRSEPDQSRRHKRTPDMSAPGTLDGRLSRAGSDGAVRPEEEGGDRDAS